MSRRTLSLSLATCTLVGVWPLLVWPFLGPDASFHPPTWLAFTIPAALAAAAIVLVIHGLKRNAELAEDTAEQLDEIRAEGAAAAVASDEEPTAELQAVTPGTTGDATIAASPRTSRTARTERPRASKGERAKSRAVAMARRKARRTFRF